MAYDNDMTTARHGNNRCVIERLEIRSLLSAVHFPGDLVVDGKGNCYASTISQRVETSSSGVIDDWGNSILHVVKYAPSWKQVWAYSVDLGSTSGSGGAMAVDGAGNIYVAGQFATRVDFDPGPGKAELTSQGSNNVFLVKLNPAGKVSWARQVGGKASVRARDITLSNNGTVYVSGSFTGVAQVGLGAGSLRLTSAGGSDAFVAGFSPSGKTLSAYRFGGRGNDQANSLAFTSTGDMLVGGGFQGSMSFGGSVPAIRSAGLQDGWVAQVGSTGNVKWAKSVGGKGYENVQKISAGPGGDIWLSGDFEGDTDLEGNEGSGGSGKDSAGGAFVGRYDQNLNPRWVGVAGNSSQSAGAMTLDAAGNTYLTTEYGTATTIWSLGPRVSLQGGGKNIVLAKVNPQGSLVWAHTVGPSGYDDTWAAAAAPSNRVWILGGNMDNDVANVVGGRAVVNQFSGDGKSLSQWYVDD